MIQFRFADIGEGIHEGQLLKWHVEKGDSIKEGDPLFLVETDKVTTDIPSPVSGTIQERYYQVGDTIHVGDVIVDINDGKETAEAVPASQREPMIEGDESVGVVGELEVSSQVIPSTKQAKAPAGKGKVLATPVARKLAKDLGVDLTALSGSGPNGRIMKADIQEAAGRTAEDPTVQKPGQPVPASALSVEEDEVRPLSQLRKTIARNMAQSKQTIPHAVSMDELDVTRLVALRRAQKPSAKSQGIHLTYLPFIVKALAHGLKAHPHMNASLDLENNQVCIHQRIHIGIAVDTPDGLLVPVIRNADQKGILQLAQEIQSLAEKARARSLSLKEMQGATFTITNYGAVGTSFGIPVIPMGQVAILGIGRIQEKPTVVNGEILPRHMLPLTLSIDHRALDGADAGRLTDTLRADLEDPITLLMR